MILDRERGAERQRKLIMGYRLARMVERRSMNVRRSTPPANIVSSSGKRHGGIANGLVAQREARAWRLAHTAGQTAVRHKGHYQSGTKVQNWAASRLTACKSALVKKQSFDDRLRGNLSVNLDRQHYHNPGC